MDFDGDGRLDLLSGSNCCDSLGFHLVRRLEHGTWAPRKHLDMKVPGHEVVLFQETFVSAADWNGDGIPDLFSKGPDGDIFVALGPLKEDEPITMSQKIAIDVEHKGFVYSFAIADWDRDGKPDLLVHQHHPDGKGGIYWYKNLGGPGLPKLAEGKLLLEITPDIDVTGFCVYDWNGDGWPDLIVARRKVVKTSTPGDSSASRGSVWLYSRESSEPPSE